MTSTSPTQMLAESFGAVVCALHSGNFSRFTPLDPPCSVQTGTTHSVRLYVLCTDGLVCREVTGLHYKLGDCTGGW